jgi:hypothetical protein
MERALKRTDLLCVYRRMPTQIGADPRIEDHANSSATAKKGGFLFVGNFPLRYVIPPLPEDFVLWTIFVILIVLWLLGFIGHVAGGFIHLLLLIAVIVLIIRLVQGRAP